MLGIFHRLLAFKCFFDVVPVSAGHPVAAVKQPGGWQAERKVYTLPSVSDDAPQMLH